jgi:hypothetical protein
MKSASASLAGPRKATNITIEARLLAAAKQDAQDQCLARCRGGFG